MNEINRKPPGREEGIFKASQNTNERGAVIDRLAVSPELKRSIVRSILKLRKSLKATQFATRANGRALPQDLILKVLIEYMQDDKQAELKRAQIQAEYEKANLRRALSKRTA